MFRLSALTAALFALSTAATVHAQTQPAAAPAALVAAPVAAPAAAPAAVAAAAVVSSSASKGDVSEGKLAYYGRKFNGRKTASGERFSAGALTMASNSLPFGTRVKVTNLANKRSVVVRVNDRGPSTPDRIGDLSLAAARKVGATKAGTINAKLEVVGTAKPRSVKRKAKKA